MSFCVVVDDSSFQRDLLKQFISKLNFDVEGYGSPGSALERCIESKPDLVLLDLNMPEMSGIEFLGQLKSKMQGEMPPVIVVTGENNTKVVKEVLGAGAKGYLVKPVSLKSLKKQISHIGIEFEVTKSFSEM